MNGKQFTPDPLGYLIQDVARLMRRRFEEEARAHGITLPQWKTLARIATSDGISQVALSALIDSDPMTLSGILDRLEKRGLIDRVPDPNDSRAKLTYITEPGAALIESARHVGRAMMEEALAGVSPEDRAILTQSLQCIQKNLNGEVVVQKELQS